MPSRFINLRSNPLGPLPEVAVAALVGADRQRWEAAGRPVNDFAQYVARKATCAGCADQVCAGCRRTEVNRWLPTQRCPLGLWQV